MIVLDGKNAIRDEIAEVVNKGGLGTVGTTTSVSESNTGLNNDVNFGLPDTINNVTYSTSDKQIIFDYTLPSTSSTGVTFREFGLNINESKLFNRQTFYDFTHNSTEEWQISVAVSIR